MRRIPIVAEATEDELHIASMVVHASPSRLADVAEVIAAIPGAEVHASTPAGKAVVTLESATADQLTATVAQIQRLPGVLSAALVYQCADTLAAMNEEMTDAQA